MTEPTRVVFMRLKVSTADLLTKIAEEEDRSAAKMADILLNIGIKTFRARQKKEREPGTH